MSALSLLAPGSLATFLPPLQPNTPGHAYVLPSPWRPSAQPPLRPGQRHRVRAKDSWSQLARYSHRTIGELLALNQRQSNPTLLPGQIVQLPSGSRPPSPGRLYELRRGDTLWALAQRFQTTVENLQALNPGLHPTQLVPGRVIRLNGAMPHRQLATLAERYLGAPYVWGGSGPTGFDCSGFVRYVLGLVDVSVPHSSFGQFRLGFAVAQDALEPGDLVFFATDGPGPSHSGIYVGQALFVSATDQGVRLSHLDSPYWSKYYVGARDVLPAP